MCAHINVRQGLLCSFLANYVLAFSSLDKVAALWVPITYKTYGKPNIAVWTTISLQASVQFCAFQYLQCMTSLKVTVLWLVVEFSLKNKKLCVLDYVCWVNRSSTFEHFDIGFFDSLRVEKK